MNDLAIVDSKLPKAEMPTERWPLQLATVFGLIALADWLLYGHAIGISAALLLLAVAAGVCIANPRQASARDMLIALGLLAAALLPVAVETHILSVLIGTLGTAYFALTMTRAGSNWIGRFRDCIVLLADSVWQATADIARVGQSWANGDVTSQRLGGLVAWVVPLALSAVFVLLFAFANPLIEEWFAALDLRSQAARISFGRIGFWLVCLSLVWPFIFMRARSQLGEHAKTEFRAVYDSIPEATLPGTLFGAAAILRSLLVFNVLFAVQTALDITYLWGGVALPDGMTYATYAHRGAYPLIATALLAAAFVVVAMQPGRDAERSPTIRALVFLWVGQNVLLVVSSILRLDLYVEVYSLTYWRVGAFIWMMLVAAGLILIVARIVLSRSNSWLVAMNLGALALALYICCFINFPQLIANFNVTHRLPSTNGAIATDTAYLISLGPQAIPALDRIIGDRGASLAPWVAHQRNGLKAIHLNRMRDWRAWTYRDWQLFDYLRRDGTETVRDIPS